MSGDSLDNLFSGTLEAAYDAVESGEEFESPNMADALDPRPDPEPETTETNDDLAPDGVEDADTTDLATEASDDEGASEPELTPPPQWSAADKAAFSELPREAQQFVLAREREQSAHLSQETQALTEQRREMAGVTNMLEPRRQALIAEYGSVEKGVETLFALSDFAVRDPKGFVEFFAKQHNVSLGDATSAESDDYVDPQYQQLTQRLQQMEGQFQQAQRQQAEEMAAAQQAEIETFKSATGEDGEPSHPHFDAVRQEMAKLVRSGAASTLSHAYEMAVWANGETRKLMLDARAKADDAKRVADAKKAAKAAKRATGTRVQSRGGVDTKPATGSMRDTMEAAYERAQGAG